MTEQESMVLSEVNSVPGLTIQIRFDSEYFKIGRFFIVEEWGVKLPIEKNGKYEPIRLKKSYIAMVSGFSSGGTVLEMTQLCEESGGIRHFDIRESLYRHGYYRLYPAKIEKEGENDNG